MKRLLLTGGALILIDQLSKKAFENIRAILTDNIAIKYAENTGAAFGILKDSTILLSVIGIIAIAAIVYYYRKLSRKKSRLPTAGLTFLFAGTAGNLIDRIFFGYVRDYIAIWKWPTFNLADTFSCIGVALIIIYLVKTDMYKPLKR